MENKIYEVTLSYTVDDGDYERLQDYERNTICLSKKRAKEVLNEQAEKYIKNMGFSVDTHYGDGTNKFLTKEDEFGNRVDVEFRIFERKEGDWCDELDWV